MHCPWSQVIDCAIRARDGMQDRDVHGALTGQWLDDQLVGKVEGVPN